MSFIFSLEVWEMLSYIVTVVGLPFALYVFLQEEKKERLNEQEEIYQKLADEYAEFSKILIDNADLQLLSGHSTADGMLTPEQREKRLIIFDLLTSLCERAYILIYEETMDKQTARLWQTWEDYINVWIERPDYRQALPGLLQGEDPDFGEYMKKKLAAFGGVSAGHPQSTP